MGHQKKAIRFRPAGLKDLQSLVEIEQTCFQFNRLNRRQFIHLLSKGHCGLWVAETKPRASIAGYGLLLFRKGSSSSRLYSLAVLPTHGGKGVGSDLLSYLEEKAKKKGCDRLSLEVHKKNKKALSLYRKKGYEFVQEKPSYYEDGEAAHCLIKKINRKN